MRAWLKENEIWWVGGVLALLALSLEFSLDVTKHPVLYLTVFIIDLLLVFGFGAYLAQSAYRSRGDLWGWVRQRRFDIIFFGIVLTVLYVPRFAASLVVMRIIAAGVYGVIDTRLGKQLAVQLNLRPSQTLALSFVLLIAMGTTLLMFPAATTDGLGTPFIDALFTITSAACVVGLAVVDTGTYYSHFGQAVILATIQVGGLGIMVMSAAFAVLLGAQLGARRQAGLSELLDVNTPESLKALVRTVAAGTLTIELLGTLFLFLSWHEDIPSASKRLWWALFHSVSAFCNAGFSLARTNLEQWVANPWISLTIAFLIILGGLGFSVLADLGDARVWSIRKPLAVWQRLQLQTKVLLLVTALLNLGGMLIFLYIEYDGVMGGLSVPTKINAAFFQAVTLRTAGFQTIDFSKIAAPTVLFCVVWMFIGGSPGSTAGGIKTTTAAVAFTSFRAMLLGREEVELFGKRIPPVVVNRSLSIILVSAVVLVVILMFLVGTQSIGFERLLFEAVSAFGTVGLSMGITPSLNDVGKVLIIVLMFVGRVGPLTMALAIGERMRTNVYRLPKGQLAVG